MTKEFFEKINLRVCKILEAGMKKKIKTPPEYFEEVNDQIFVVDVARKLGFRVKKSGRAYIMRCPFHKEKTPSCRISYGYFNNAHNRYHCFGCGHNGDAFDLVRFYLFEGNKVKTYRWFKKNYDIKLPWEK